MNQVNTKYTKYSYHCKLGFYKSASDVTVSFPRSLAIGKREGRRSGTAGLWQIFIRNNLVVFWIAIMPMNARGKYTHSNM